MLQNLANKPSYAKEQYMMSLNPFVENNKTRMNLFLNALCEVGDFYDSLEVCSTSYRSLLWVGTGADVLARSIYGTVQEGPSNQYYAQ